MKSFLLVSVISTLVLPALALGSARNALGDRFEGKENICEKRIATAVYKKAAKQFGSDTAETMSILSVKPITGKLDQDSIVTAYFVEVSDEVEPSQWLVVAETEDCVVEYISQSM